MRLACVRGDTQLLLLHSISWMDKVFGVKLYLFDVDLFAGGSNVEE